jgi:hypothetical protein
MKALLLAIQFKHRDWRAISVRRFSIDCCIEKDVNTERNRELILFHGRDGGGEAICGVP